MWRFVKAPRCTAAPAAGRQLWRARGRTGHRIQPIAANGVTFPNQNVWLPANYSFPFRYSHLKNFCSSLFLAKCGWRNINGLSSGSVPGYKRHFKSSRRQSWKWDSPTGLNGSSGTEIQDKIISNTFTLIMSNTALCWYISTFVAIIVQNLKKEEKIFVKKCV